MTDVIVKYRVTVVESEAGWGQSYDTEYYDTREAAMKRVHNINADNTASTTPSWYMRANYDGPKEGIMTEVKGQQVFRELN